MEIIIISKTEGKGGYEAHVHGKSPRYQTFAKSEVEALKQLAEKILERNSKEGRTAAALYRINNPL